MHHRSVPGVPGAPDHRPAPAPGARDPRTAPAPGAGPAPFPGAPDAARADVVVEAGGGSVPSSHSGGVPPVPNLQSAPGRRARTTEPL